MKQSLQEYTKSQLSEKRYEHSLCVSKIAVSLAKIHDQDTETAQTAGLSHDLAREWKYEDMFKFLIDRNINTSDSENKIPILLHGKVASIIIQEKFNINDIEIINAIENHTLGRADMSEIEKIIFISDYLASAKDSDRYSEVYQVANKSLNDALLLIFKSNYDHYIQNDFPIADEFFDVWNYYKNSVK